MADPRHDEARVAELQRDEEEPAAQQVEGVVSPLVAIPLAADGVVNLAGAR